jgi:hypothetical protein
MQEPNEKKPSKQMSIWPFVSILFFSLSCLILNAPPSKPLPQSVEGLAFLNNLFPSALFFILALLCLLPLLGGKSKNDNHKKEDDNS